MSKYCIANTTKAEREQFVAHAVAINSLGAQPLTEENRTLLKRYVDGEIELDDLQKKIIDKYKKSCDHSRSTSVPLTERGAK